MQHKDESQCKLDPKRWLSSPLQSADKTISESLVLDDSEEGVVIKGITDDAVAAKSGLQAGNGGRAAGRLLAPAHG